MDNLDLSSHFFLKILFTCIIKADPCLYLRDNFLNLSHEAVSNENKIIRELRRA